MKIKNKRLFVLCSIILFIGFAWLSLLIIPPKKVVDNNPFIIEKGSSPLIAAHRGGALLNPENTFMAFDYAIEKFDIDILELDLCMTKDNKLVVIHNLTLNSCTDVLEVYKENKDYYVNDYNLTQLQKLNFGYNFTNEKGLQPYRDLLDNVSEEDKSIFLKEAKLRIVTIEELFEVYHNTDLKFIIEIKNKEDLGIKAADILCSNIYEYGLEKRVVIGTFNTEVEKYISEKYPQIYRGASMGSAKSFILTQMFGLNIFDKSDFTCLQICPTYEFKGINLHLDKQTYIRRAHRRGMSVQYWTINDKEEMRALINKGVDVIMTDNPQVLYELLKEMNYR